MICDSVKCLSATATATLTLCLLSNANATPTNTHRLMAANSSSSGGGEAGTGEDLSWLLEEIVVTAQKREQNLQQLPFSIAAFSGERLDESGISNIQGMQFLAAGIQIGDVVGQTRVALRGIGTDNQEIGAESGVAVHLDGVFLAQVTSLNSIFFDVERVEVLRGPQGTLYGRNATGGAINIITKAPTSVFMAGAKLTLGNYDHIQTEGFISGPLVDDKLTARLAYASQKHSGFSDNPYSQGHLNDTDISSIRAKLNYEPHGDLSIDLALTAVHDTSVSRMIYERPSADAPMLGELFGGMPGVDDRDINIDFPDSGDKVEWGISGRVEWQLEDMTLVSLTSYRKPRYDFNMDMDGTDAPLLFLTESREFYQASQEFNLHSASLGKLEWLLGAYLFYQSASDYVEFAAPAFSSLTIIDTPDIETEAYAIFGEGTYSLTNNLKLTLGVRLDYEKKHVEGETRTNGVVESSVLHDDSWNSLSPKISLSYNFNPKVMAYGVISRGFKAGGANLSNAYDPEYVTNYELGLKTQSFGDRLRTNLSLFSMDYKDLQVQTTQFVGGLHRPILTNAANSKIHGVELDFEARFSNRLIVSGNLAYLDTTYKKFISVDDLNGEVPIDVSGNRLTQTPEYSANWGVEYKLFSLEQGETSFRAEHSYQSEVFFSPQNDDLRRQDSYDWFNARFTFTSHDDNWSVSLYGKNLTDEKISGAIDYTVGINHIGRSLLAPRTYGISIACKLNL